MENFGMLAMLIIVMMSMRVPSQLAKFNSYILNAVNYLNFEDPDTHVLNGARLGLATSEMDKLNEMLHTWLALFGLHTDTQTKTKITRVSVVSFIKSFRLFFGPILNRINGSVNCTDADRMELNIAIPKPHGSKKVQIKDEVYEIAKQLGGGEIAITCRTTSDGKRGKIHPDASGWYIAYDIVDPTLENPELYPKIKLVAPIAPTECFNSSLHSKAKDVLNVGDENIGRELVYFVRWYNHRNPALSGPYGPAKTIIIL